jgi:glutathione S-transferase
VKIYWIKAQAPLRVLALVKHLGVAAELIEVDLIAGGLKTAAYAALNPNKKAPVLLDGNLVLWEASAIMAHLCITTGSDMWPAHNPAEQVEVLRWLSWNDNHWSPAVAPFYFEHIVKTTFRFAEADLASLPAHVPELLRYAKVLDAHLEGRIWVACARLTIADFQLASMATYWRQSDMPFETFPNIVRWLDGLTRVPAWADPWPNAEQAA